VGFDVLSQRANLKKYPIRILLLEDDANDVELCRHMLASQGAYVLNSVSDAEQFKREVYSNDYDVILGDYRLPNWSGLEAIRWLKELSFTIPFILVTGTLGDEVAVECIKEGATDYILKDKLERLPFAIERAVHETKLRCERDRAERELRESEQEYASIVDGAPYGIYRMDQTGRILMANPAFIKMLGYEHAAEVLELNMKRDIYLNVGDWHEALGKLEQNALVSHPEVTWRRKDGRTIIVRIEGRRFETVPGGVLLYEVFAQDITEHRIMEKQFHQAQKMEAIGRLAGGVAHDFNNLLMIIRGCAELLDYHKADPGRIGGYIKQINDATSIAASVVQQLMAFSRKQVPERTSVDCNDVLRDLRKLLPRILGEDIHIVFSPGQAIRHISADRSQIEQIVLNLAINARDAMPNGGRLVLKTENIVLSSPQIGRGGVELLPGPYVVFSVADNGTGMSAEIQSHIFEPFFTTKEQGKGTGLGLATVYGIVKDSGGFIDVNSDVGQGTTFRIYLPAITEKKEAGQSVQPVGAPGGAETILLVEDEAALREITCEYLQSRGYSVLTASSGLHALDICRTYEQSIDILLTDIIMPGIRGPELVKSALDMRPHIRVIYVSGYTDRDMESVALESDAVFLRKPYSLADLGHKIRAAMQSPTPAAITNRSVVEPPMCSAE
jgi:two-component system, cell cycle sensor histidine kinase and response regulator CckA